MTEKLTVITIDGIALSINVFATLGPRKATVLFAGGVGVPQRIYQPLAEWLASHGFRCVTFDYRGMGDSRSSLRAIHTASLSSWAKQDTTAVFEFIEKKWQEPVVLIAHSFGGQLLALAEPLQRLQVAVLIASQCGTSKYWSGFQRVKIATLWYLLLPAAARLGDVTPKWLGLQLPAGVSREWARWGRQPDWLFSLHADAGPRLQKFSAPVLAYSVADDDLAPPAAVAALVSRFNPERIRNRLLESGSFKQKSIGHHGVFRVGRTPAVWTEILEFLVDELAVDSSAR